MANMPLSVPAARTTPRRNACRRPGLALFHRRARSCEIVRARSEDVNSGVCTAIEGGVTLQCGDALAPSPLPAMSVVESYSGERVGVRGGSSSGAARKNGPSPQPSPPSTGERGPEVVRHNAALRPCVPGFFLFLFRHESYGQKYCISPYIVEEESFACLLELRARHEEETVCGLCTTDRYSGWRNTRMRRNILKNDAQWGADRFGGGTCGGCCRV